MNKKGKGKLYIVATPIGNLGDITLRALEKLKEVGLILCEDTRVSKKLLDHYQIQKPLLSYHQHSRLQRLEKIKEHLQAGKNLALITDAGTPGLADPGNQLVAELLKEEIKIEVLPGVSALTALISLAGISMQQFVFLGFPPHKKGRESFFKEVEELSQKRPVIFYESKYRFLKTLATLRGLSFNIIVGRELTKMHEEIKRGTVEEIFDYYQDNPQKIKGEFTLIVYKKK